MNAELQERIENLERELVSVKLQLACAKSSEDHLKLDLAKARLALAKATGGNVPTSHSESSRPDCAVDKPLRLQNVDPANPLSRKTSRDELASYRPRKAPHTNRFLNPSSCASALNLYAEIDAPPHWSTDVDSRGGGALSLRRPNNNSSSSRADRLNPNSCASGLNLQLQPFALGVDRLNPKSCASGLNLLFAQGLQSLATSGKMSLSSLSSSIPRKSSHDIALLISNSRKLSASSFSGRRRVGSRNNARLGNKRYPTHGSANRNSEWGELK